MTAQFPIWLGGMIMPVFVRIPTYHRNFGAAKAGKIRMLQ